MKHLSVTSVIIFFVTSVVRFGQENPKNHMNTLHSTTYYFVGGVAVCSDGDHFNEIFKCGQCHYFFLKIKPKNHIS